MQKHRRHVGVLDGAKRSPKGEQSGGGCESKRRFAGGRSFGETGAGGNLTKADTKIQGLTPCMLFATYCDFYISSRDFSVYLDIYIIIGMAL